MILRILKNEFHNIRGNNLLKVGIVGSVLIWLSQLILPIIIFIGFVVRWVNLTPKERETMPFFLSPSKDENKFYKNWRSLLNIGAKVTVLWLIFAIPPAIISGLIAIKSGGTQVDRSLKFSIFLVRVDFLGFYIGGLIGSIAYIIGLILYLIIISLFPVPDILINNAYFLTASSLIFFSYIFPPVMVLFSNSRNKKLLKKWDGEELYQIIMNRTYFKSWLICSILLLTGWAFHAFGYLSWWLITPSMISSLVGFNLKPLVSRGITLLIMILGSIVYSITLIVYYASISEVIKNILDINRSSE
jgi:hypothetical protein